MAERDRTARIAGVTVFVTGSAAMLIGEALLDVFGIQIPSFRIAGGIIILLISLSMLNANDMSAGDSKAVSEKRGNKQDIAVVPLSIPLIVGPGTIATVIVFAHRLDPWSEIVTMLPVVGFVSVMVWLSLKFADRISAVTGKTVISVITRVMAIVLAAVAIEMIITGVVHVIDANYPHLRDAAAAMS